MKKIKNINKWHKWFAWYPVKTVSGVKCWLKFIQRRKYHSMFFNSWWIYKQED
jgi:hypothetical protein